MVDFAQIAQKQRASSAALVPGDYFAFGGGLDLETPPLQKKPGSLLGCLNYELKVVGGYQSLAGYERFDGQPKPSQAAFWDIPFSGSMGTVPNVGDTVVSSSGGSGVVLAFSLESGVLGTLDSALTLDADVTMDALSGIGDVVLGQVTGTFNDGDTLTHGGWSAVQSASVTENDPLDEADAQTYQQLAIAAQRALIQKVPGSGPILGVCIYRGLTYAFRNNTEGSAAAMWVQSPTSWTLVDLGAKLHFSAGSGIGFTAGQIVTGATSGATGTIRRVVIDSGTFAGSNAAGFLILYGITGNFQNGENLNVPSPAMTMDAGVTLDAALTMDALSSSGGAVGVAAGTANPQVLAPNGKYEFVVYNFYGATGDLAMYGADGVNYGFEFQDGDEGWFAQIETGMPIDKPNHVTQFFGYLWLSFPGGSVQRSAINDPVAWNVILGSAEYGIGDDCTGFLTQVKTLYAFSTKRTVYWQDDGLGDGGLIFDTYNDKIGAQPASMQNIGSGMTLDSRGFSTIASTQKYGSFTSVPVSMLLDTLVKQLVNLCTCSAIIRSKSIYRCFFSNNAFISATWNGQKIVGFTAGNLNLAVRCIFSDQDEDANELTVFGSDSGYVYQMDSGTSFDGASIVTFLRTPFYHNKSPGTIKRYRRASFDMVAANGVTLTVGVDYTYSQSGVKADPIKMLDAISGGGFWDTVNWDQFTWSNGLFPMADVKLEGSGQNISFLVASNSSTQGQHEVDGVTVMYSHRRLERSTVA
jgi:hypothetical protein